jgi:tetratricopeptide (TPR) repeat protein
MRLQQHVTGPGVEPAIASTGEWRSSTLGPYTLISKIGQGGMGSVWLAERTDGEIQQRVAIKLLTVDDRLPEWREHFLRERQLLASLNHSSIVRVVDAGHTEDRVPYLVMEYVEGATIDAYAAGISGRERLELFLRVCDGVAHAHRHLIIHRDLKPANILVDAEGRPKLLDFGIAKLLDDTVETTQTAPRLLTPHYASPEQRNGMPQTTATDVYSLGALLHHLLTGCPPRQQASGELEIAPIPDRTVPSDVTYVLRKALRHEPDERYPSVDAFAKDVRALLESKPVQARAGDAWYRVRKFVSRRWMPVTAVAVLVCSLLSSLFIVNRERALAQWRFQQARKLAHTFVFDLHDEIARLSGSTKVRETTVRTGLQYLDSLARDAEGDLNLQKELADAYLKIGDAEGFPTYPNLGQQENALKSFRKAGDLYVRIAAKDDAYLPDLARYYTRYAGFLRFTHNLTQARDLSEASIQTFDRIRTRHPLDSQSEQDYLGAWCTLGDMDEDLGRYRAAWTDFTRCRDLARIRLDRVRDRRTLSQLSQADERVGTAAHELGRLNEALLAFDEDQSLLDELIAKEPRNPKYQRRRALVDHYRANVYYSDTGASLDDVPRALENARRYLSRTEEMVRNDANDVTAQLSRAIAMLQVSFCLQETDAAASVTAARNSVRLFDAMIASGDRTYLTTSRRARAMVRLGEAEFRAGRIRQALPIAEAALSAERPLAGKDAEESAEHTLLVLALMVAGRVNAASGNFARAETLLREAREEARTIANGGALEDVVSLANAEKTLGAFYVNRNRVEEARACYQHVIDLWRRFPQRSEYVDRQRSAAALLLESAHDHPRSTPEATAW